MRRLSVARDRELRHAAQGQIAWRYSFLRPAWYAWCRVCSREATAQVDWLVGSGFLEPVSSAIMATVNVLTTDHVKPYLERYPR